MAKNSNKQRSFAGSATGSGIGYGVYYGPLGSILPTDLTTDPATLGLSEVGLLTDAGTTESHAYGNETTVFDASGSPIRVLRSQEARNFAFAALETNPNVEGLLYPSSVPVVTGGTAEVQSVVISGTPTGGTFNLTLAGYGSPATGLAYNITNTALASALTAAFGITVTVSGAGPTYTVTFPVSEGNVPQMTATSALTGGTTPGVAVSTTTPGVTGLTTIPIGAATGRYLFAWVIDATDGSYRERFTITQGEAVQSGDIQRAAGQPTEYQFNLTTYKDSNGFFVTKLHN